MFMKYLIYCQHGLIKFSDKYYNYPETLWVVAQL